VELETMLVSLFVLVDDWWESVHRPSARKLGRPPSLSDPEVLTLAILAQWPRWRGERDFFRFAYAHLRGYFPNLLSHGQLNRRIRALGPELKAFQWNLAATLADGSEVYHVLDTTLIPAIVRVRACRKGLFAGQAAFGRCVSKTEWVLIEGVIDQLKDIFALERHRAKTLEGLLTRLAAKVAAYTVGQVLSKRLERPIRHLASLLV
jgi:hypothetical protein